MEKIHIFSSISEAVNILSQYNKVIKKKDLTKEEIIKKSVSSSIFRAFHKLDKRPSDIYRKWASENIDKIIIFLNNTNSKEKFDEEILKFIKSFIDYWNEQVVPENRIIFGPASKIINLLIKMLNESKLINNENIIPFLNVPFDEYSIKPLIKIINQLSEVNYRIDIPKNPTMKYITTLELYLLMQKAVNKLCKEAGIHPILYDYWCWNEKH